MSTPFLGVFRAIYEYVPQNDEEMPLAEGDLLYLVQKSDFDDWWTVKKRVVDADEDEPQGLVPSTYIEPAKTIATAKALFDYTKQTEEEISFTEGAILNVYDTSDANWTLADVNGLQFGFVPANYIEIQKGEPVSKLTITETNSPTSTLPTPKVDYFPPPPQRMDRASPTPDRDAVTSTSYPVHHVEEEEEEEAPPMPSRPRPTTQTATTTASRDYDDNDDYNEPEEQPKRNRSSSFFGKSRSRSNTDTSNNRKSSFFSSSKSSADNDVTEPVHGDFAWKIHEIESKKKRRGVLEIGNNKIYLDIENKLDEQWPIKNLVNYNNEKKHIFLDFKSPSYSFELYVSNKDSANAIVSILGDMKGLQSESALKEVKKAHNTGARQGAMKSGRILYDFIGQGGDELTVLEGDKISIVNDKKSKDWWLIENSNGDRGVVPSNYVKLVDDKKSKEGGFMKSLFSSGSSNNKSPKKPRSSDKEERLLRENARMGSERDDLLRKQRELERKEKELIAKDREQRDRIRRADDRLREKRLREESKRSRSESNSSNSNKLPNSHRVRTWIDRSGSFKVEAEFLGLQEGKIHLHKINGVKIAVAANKLSMEDLEYVERLTGTSLDKYKPKSKSKSPTQVTEDGDSTPSLPSRSNVTQKQKALPMSAKLIDYWFNFFVESGVDVAVCERYSRNFASEQVDENILSEITPALMRTLGVKEGDILRVKRFIDIKLGKSVTPEPMLPAATGTVPPPPPGIGTRSLDPLPPMPSASLTDDSWATKPASKVNNDDKLTPQITGSIQDLLDVKPMKPTKTGITPVKPISTLPGETIGQLKDIKTGGNQQMIPMTAMPTGFMPITMIPMMTGALTGALTGGLTNGLSNGLTGGAMRTGGIIPITSFGMPSNLTGGLNNLYAAPQQQKTGGGFIMPLNTGGISTQMPQTSFGVNNGMVKLQPTGVMLQKTGGNIPSMQPTMKTGGFMPQSTFGMQITGGLPQIQQPMNGGFPQTSFGNPALTGGLPQTSFGNPAMTGGFPQTSFGNPAMTGGLPQTSFGNPAMTGGFPQTSFVNPAMTGGFPQASFNQQPSMNGMYQQPIQQQPQFGGMNPAMTGGFPQTSFGQPQQQNVPLQSQPTGFGFGNSNGQQANLANATAANPFGF